MLPATCYDGTEVVFITSMYLVGTDAVFRCAISQWEMGVFKPNGTVTIRRHLLDIRVSTPLFTRLCKCKEAAFKCWSTRMPLYRSPKRHYEVQTFGGRKTEK